MGLFKTHSERYLKKIEKDINRAESISKALEPCSDDELKDMAARLKKMASSEGCRAILPEAFALVREASRRTIGLYPYRVQMLAGRALFDGKIAEQCTGEGKTLTAVMPAFLAALEGKGVHIVTVNDYLADRDSSQMGQVFSFLGLTTGKVLSGMTREQRKQAYACDITYVTNNELGFDFLRDNMVWDQKDRVLGDLHYAIIDEVDSILIDEARTPLIISGPSGESDRLYQACSLFVDTLQRGHDLKDLSKYEAASGDTPKEDGDYMANEKEKKAVLTARGIEKTEKFFKMGSYGDPSNAGLRHHMDLALRAKTFMKRDRDYIVRDGQVLIVDEFTGRVMDGRRYSDGLHQAIEAKEKVEVKKENRTLATITFQNFFNKYEKKAGMTGTAMTEKKEFMDIYGLDVIAIPTNLPVRRIDLEDRIFATKEGKYKAVIEEALKAHAKGQPVLIGTADIGVSELLSKMLGSIPHQVLNAKQDKLEAQIIEGAGACGALTIATNMAGRGTDIRIDDGARQAGGLMIIGTQRHESRRIDNQLRGRSGRQGDPGQSQFFISLEDDMMRVFATGAMKGIFKGAGELSSAGLSKAVERAQKAMEGNNFTLRRNLMNYDRVLDEHRDLVYAQREEILHMDDISGLVESLVDSMPAEDLMEAVPHEQGQGDLAARAKEIFAGIRGMTGDQLWERVQRDNLLYCLDRNWREHIDDMQRLKDGIGFQAKAQRDPVTEYRRLADEEYNRMMDSVAKDAVMALCGARFEERDGKTVLSIDH